MIAHDRIGALNDGTELDSSRECSYLFSFTLRQKKIIGWSYVEIA